MHFSALTLYISASGNDIKILNTIYIPSPLPIITTRSLQVAVVVCCFLANSVLFLLELKSPAFLVQTKQIATRLWQVCMFCFLHLTEVIPKQMADRVVLYQLDKSDGM